MRSKIFIQSLGLLSVTLGFSSHAELTNLSVGFNYSNGRGPGYGAVPLPYGYGPGAGSIGAIGGVCGSYLTMPAVASCGVICGNGGYYQPAPMPQPGFMPPPMPAIPPIPPPAPIIPPHVAMPTPGWGPGFSSFPGPVTPGPGYGVNCIPCQIGYAPMPIGPVPGGPYLNSYNGVPAWGTGYGDPISDTTWATAVGLGMQTTNVFPIAVPRNQPTVINPLWFQTGPRPATHVPRPDVGP